MTDLHRESKSERVHTISMLSILRESLAFKQKPGVCSKIRQTVARLPKMQASGQADGPSCTTVHERIPSNDSKA